jgi:proteasome-associated ATPase
LYRSDLISGAIIASVVERAKAMAIKRAIANQTNTVIGVGDRVSGPLSEGITEQDLQMSFHAEYAENDIFPPTDITEDWLKLIDYDPEYVVKIAPFRLNAAHRPSNLGGVI